LEVVDERWAWLSGHYRHGVTLAPLSSLEALEFAERFA
jgi:glycine/D-amino acid oxidase-like deaminating enzyme